MRSSVPKNNGFSVSAIAVVFLFLVLGIPSALAITDNQQFPYVNYNGNVGDYGLFNENIVPNYYPSVALTTPTKLPLVADLDNDGKNEIIVLDGLTFKVFQNTTLNAVGGYTTNITNVTSNVIIYDIDGDGHKEIMFGGTMGAQQAIQMVDFNASGLVHKATLGVTTNTAAAGTDLEIMCSGTETCVVFGTFRNAATGGATDILRAAGFNLTYMNTSQIDVLTSGTQEKYCFPQVSGVAVGDVNSDGTQDYAVTAVDVTSGSETWNVGWVSNSISSLKPTLLGSGSVTGADIATNTAGKTCSNFGSVNVRNYATAPLVFDASPFTAGDETVFGTQKSTTGYNMVMYTGSTLAYYDEYPDSLFVGGTTEAGVLLSNVFRADAMASDGQKDFCMIGDAYAGSVGSGGQSEINLLCGSAVHTADCVTGQCQHASFDGQVSYNISNAVGSQRIFTQASQQSRATTESGGNYIDHSDLDEISTSFGIFKLTYASDNTLDSIYSQPKGDAAVVMADIQKVGLADMLALTGTNLWYIDDGYENTGAKITSITTNPCYQGVIKINSTVQVSVTVQDEQTTANLDNDLVSAKVTAYAGVTNEQTTAWAANASAGSTFTFSFTANQTAPSATLTAYGIDTGDPADIDSNSLTFTVANDGAEFGDSTCSASYSLASATNTTEAALNASRAPDLTNNAITNPVNTYAEMTGLGTTLIWFIVLIVAVIAILAQSGFLGWHLTVGLIAAAGVTWTIVGVMLHFLSAAVIIVLVIIAVLLLAIPIVRIFTHGGG